MIARFWLCNRLDHGSLLAEARRGGRVPAADQMRAAPLGEPLLPGVRYLVVSVFGGETRDFRLYAWSGGSGRYEAEPLEHLGV